MEKKYVLSKNVRHIKVDGENVKIYQIMSQVDIPTVGVHVGDLGGWVETIDNLSHTGKCWLYNNAIVCGKAVVEDDARIAGCAIISGHAVVKDSAIVKKNAQVKGNAVIMGNADISDDCVVSENAIVQDTSMVYGYGKVYGNAKISGNSKIHGYAVILGDTEIENSNIHDGYLELYLALQQI